MSTTKTFTEEEITERLRVLANRPIDRAELAAFTASVNGPLKSILESLTKKLDGVPFDEAEACDRAIKFSETVIRIAEDKKEVGLERSHQERLAIRYLGFSIYHLSGDADAETKS
jgi:hypothetical protein